jgi:hypothetical protein
MPSEVVDRVHVLARRGPSSGLGLVYGNRYGASTITNLDVTNDSDDESYQPCDPDADYYDSDDNTYADAPDEDNETVDHPHNVDDNIIDHPNNFVPAADLDVHLQRAPIEGVYNTAVVEHDDNEEQFGEPITVEDDDEEEEEIMSDNDYDGPDNESEPGPDDKELVNRDEAEAKGREEQQPPKLNNKWMKSMALTLMHTGCALVDRATMGTCTQYWNTPS